MDERVCFVCGQPILPSEQSAITVWHGDPPKHYHVRRFDGVQCHQEKLTEWPPKVKSMEVKTK